MNNERKQWLLKQYSQGSLTNDEMKALENAIDKGLMDLDDLDNYQEIDDYFSKNHIEELWTGNADQKFYESLDDYVVAGKKTKILKFSSFIPLGIAASLLLLIGVWIGKSDSVVPVEKDNQVKNEMVFSAQLNETDNISERIHLIVSREDQTIDQDIIETLLYTLNTDESANVRIACIEVLTEYTHHSAVREGLISSIRYQVSPAVISNLIHAIKKGGVNLSDEDYKSKLNKEIPEPLRNNIEESINKI